MKLHLPKALLTAVLAACVANTTAWGTWGEPDTFYFTGSETSMSTDEEGHTNETTYLKAASDGSGNSGTIDSVTIGQGDKLVVTGFWNSTTANFESLTIKELTAGTEAELQVAGAQAANNASIGKQNVTINSMTGTLSKLTVLDKGNLTLGKEGDTSSTYTIGSGDIASGATLTLAGGTTTIGTSTDQSFNTPGELIVKTGAVLKFVDTDVMNWNSSHRITLDGGKWAVGNTRQSLGGNTILNLSGGSIEAATDAETGATIYGDGAAAIEINSDNVLIKSSGASAITGGIRVAWNRALTIEVLGGTLSVDCIFDGNGKGTIAKKGAGTLKFTAMGATNNKNETFYKGDTTLSDGGTIEYALASGEGSYTGTISGTGNVAKSGAGSVTLANVSNLDGSITVTEGTLTITSLSTDKTMNVSVSSGSLSIGSVVVNPDTMELSAKEGATVTQYYSMDGGTTQNSEGNGFLYTSGDYVLFNGYVWNGNLGNGLSVTSDGTNTYVTADTKGTTYYLTSATADIDAAELGADTYAVQGGTMNLTKGTANVAYSSGSIIMAKETYMSINSGSSLTDIVKNTTGTGTILVESNAQIGTNSAGTTSSEFAGTIKVTGGTLNLGETDGQNDGHYVQLSQLTIELAGGTAEIFGSTSSLGKLSVTENANFSLFEVKANGTAADFDVGEISVSKDKTLTITTRSGGAPWHARVNVAALTGEGNFVINTEQPDRRTYNFDTIGTSTMAFGNITNKETMNLGANGESLLNMGNVTNTSSATLNIRGNLAGTSTISGGTINLESTANISGDITFASNIHIGGTIANTGSFTLSGNVTIADIHALKNNTIYSDNEGKDGYISSGIYYVVESSGAGSATASEGLLLNSTHTITAENGNLVFHINNETPGGVYYVNTRDFTVDGSDTNAAKDATGYCIAADRTLTLAGNQSDSMTAGKILSEATGEGNIIVASDITLTAGSTSEVKGTLTIQDCTVEVDTSFTNTNHYDTKRAVTSLSSFSAVNLDNAVIKYIGKSTSLQNVTVKKTGATLKFNDMGDASGEYYTLAGITQLEGDLTIEKFVASNGAWKYGVKIEQLTGNGNISFTSADQAGLLKIDSLQGTDTLAGYSGAISMTKGAAGAATLTVTTGGSATLSGLSLLSGATAEFINGIKDNVSPGGTLGLGAVKMSGGSQLTLTNGGAERTTDITSLEVTGSATIGTKRHGDCYQGTINISSLTNTGDSATLTLRNGSQIDNATIFNINGGTFKGTINLEADSAKGNNEPSRKLHAYLNNESVAQGAVINFQDPSTETNTDKAYNYITLGVGANTVKVAGLTGTTTNAATIKSTGDSGTRTLEISTAQGADYSTNAKVEASVNLVKSGEGTQTFTSDSIASTSIAVNGGVLALTGLAELQLQDLVVKSGATLNVGADNSGVVMVGSPVAPASTTFSTPSAKLEGGATINGSLNLSNASSLTLDGIGENSLVTINGDLILPGASETPTLTLSGDILNSLAAMNLGDTLGIFSVGGGFFVGDQVTDALDATNGGIALNTVFAASGDYDFEGYYLGFIPDEGYSTVYIGKIVPEPTTATLSLLALAALAARRRRK